MPSRSHFASQLSELELKHVERAIALLWYYRQTQQFDDRTASELANDLHDEGFPKLNVTRLEYDLKKSRCTVAGKRRKAFQIDLRRIKELDERYGDLLKLKKVEVTDTIIPSEWVTGTRRYLEQMVLQINGCYQSGYYDACAVLSRRLMESLIIEIYISQNRHAAIKSNGVFVMLDKLITIIRTDNQIHLSRNTPKTMDDIKKLGDTAAHDRTYVTQQLDIDDIKAAFRRMIRELLTQAGINP